MTEENILDENDLNKYFQSFKQDILLNKMKDWQSLYSNNKEKLNLRFHQELITQKNKSINRKRSKIIFMGV